MADKTTAQQQADNLAYHNRDLTLRGMALSNWMREYFDESVGPPAGEYPYGICFGGDTITNFVAVGAATSVAIQKSPAGSYWEVMQLGKKLGAFAGNLYDVCYGNGLYVAVGDAEEIQTAPEALPSKWDQRRTGEGNALFGVCYGSPGGSPLYVAVGTNGTILTSPDGENWTVQSPAGAYSSHFRAVCWTGALYVAVGEDGEIQTSQDGVNWTAQSAYGSNVADFNDVTTGVDIDGNLLIVAVGAPIAGDVPIVQASSNGITWVEKTPQTSRTTNGAFTALVYAEDVYIASGSNGEIQVSYDYGETWVFQYGCNLNSYSIAFGRDTFCMCAADNKSFSGVPYGLVLRTLRRA